MIPKNAITGALSRQWQEYKSWSLSDATFSSLCAEDRTVVEMSKFLATVSAANYQMSNKQKLFLILLVDGHSWRAHSRQNFHYDDGAWKMVGALSIEVWDTFLAVEGLFLDVAERIEAADQKVEWSWNHIVEHVQSIVRQKGHDLIPHMIQKAKQESDHLRQTTGNKAWKANWLVADMLSTFRVQWDGARASQLSKLFLTEWDTQLPKSSGVCFSDVYMDASWKEKPKSPANDCYMSVPYPFFYESSDPAQLERHKAKLRLFLQSLYYKNEHVFEVKLAALHCAFQKVCTSKILFEIGKGGDGKGMEPQLEVGLLGVDQSSTLDCGVFLDRAEFRKSAEFAWNKAPLGKHINLYLVLLYCVEARTSSSVFDILRNVHIQEMDCHGRFVADLWKRFVADEEIDCRVNYGFTAKRRFGNSLKVQELNYENIPVIEEGKDRKKACDQITRRIICLRMGKAQFTSSHLTQKKWIMLQASTHGFRRMSYRPSCWTH